MAAAIYRTALDRLARTDRLKAGDELITPRLTQFTRSPDGFTPATVQIPAVDRPPMITVPEYRVWRGSPEARL